MSTFHLKSPMHTAVTCSNSAIAKVLIQCAEAQHRDPWNGLGTARQMLRMVDNMKNTALQLVVLSRSTHVTKILIEKDLDSPYYANDHGQIPSYLTVHRRII